MDDSLGMPSIYSLTRVLGPGRHSLAFKDLRMLTK